MPARFSFFLNMGTQNAIGTRMQLCRSATKTARPTRVRTVLKQHRTEATPTKRNATFVKLDRALGHRGVIFRILLYLGTLSPR